MFEDCESCFPSLAVLIRNTIRECAQFITIKAFYEECCGGWSARMIFTFPFQLMHQEKPLMLKRRSGP
ncbi:hypothetical protein SAMN05444358_102208 [Ruegeria halocynthiae]|uniref:Uncharacterized protein n=1 Tax=Ruegeria halocynthiae TaxID=985054 RepID=A0A1H2YA37_9RHOB|nr:hypothetical protein SAMN05444358_102208 [Ruegeria halocynthiae]